MDHNVNILHRLLRSEADLSHSAPIGILLDFFGILFYDAFPVTGLYSVDGKVTGEC
jgi:hypothetical protein